MAAVLVTYSCGCGYHTENQKEAIKHSDAKKHTLTVLGTIRTLRAKKQLHYSEK